MSLYKSLFITSIVISTLLIKTPNVLAEHSIIDIYIEETQYYIEEPSTPIGGFSLVLDDYYDTLEHENEPRIALMALIEESYTDLEVPSKNAFKSYMSYRAITDKTSRQYELQQSAITDELGLRTYNGRYCVAVGTYYGDVYEEIDVIMENGTVIECVVSDIKDDKHTNHTNQKHKIDGSVVEFIVDIRKLDKLTQKMGDISYVDEMFSGEIDFIRKYEVVTN